MLNIDLWQQFIKAFSSEISKADENQLASAWSSPQARTKFYKEMLSPLAMSLGMLIEEDLEAGSELFKVDFAICRNSKEIKVPLIFIESENNAFSDDHEVRKLVNLAAPLRVLITVIQWDEDSDVFPKAYRSSLLPRWEEMIRQHQIVWPRPGVVGILIGEWRPDKKFRFYGYGYGEGHRLAVPNPEILFERQVRSGKPNIDLNLLTQISMRKNGVECRSA